MISIYNQKSNAWRDQYNPLRGMNLPKLLALLDSGERGQYADLQWFYHYMERSDAMVFSVMQRRRAALLACDWDIRQVADATAGDHRPCVTKVICRAGREVGRVWGTGSRTDRTFRTDLWLGDVADGGEYGTDATEGSGSGFGGMSHVPYVLAKASNGP